MVNQMERRSFFGFSVAGVIGLAHRPGLVAAGLAYPLALSRTDTEWAGACFSPDGKTLFVNLYRPAKTVAITGPWLA